MTELPRNTILQGDASTRLAELPAASIDMAVFSPPYPLARDYGVAGQLGAEPTVSEWVANLVRVMDEVARVMKPTGSAWINVADVYSKHPKYGAPAKSALLAPERLLVALVDAGWRVRSKAVWVKTNAQPSSARDRLANRYELMFFLVRSKRYFFALDEIRRPHTSRRRHRRSTQTSDRRPSWAGPLAGTQAGLSRPRFGDLPGDPLGRNPGDVIELATAAFRGPHHAVYPKGLVTLPILATCPERTCSRCGQPWRRNRVVAGTVPPRSINPERLTVMEMGRGPLRQMCKCDAPPQPGVVLDPFMGSGTTAVVAKQLGRDFIGVELNPAFCTLAEQRLREEVSA